MTPSPETRFTLIEKIKDRQDVEAWLEFASIYQPLIFNICRSKGMQHADATDVTQEVLARVAKAIETFNYNDRGATFRGWLYRITRNMAMDFFRQRKRNLLAQTERPIDPWVDNEPSCEEAREFQTEFRRQVFVVVAKAVQAQVKPDTWTAFWQTEMEQRSVEEVAANLGMTAGAIYVARSRILARLKKEVQKRLNETDQYIV